MGGAVSTDAGNDSVSPNAGRNYHIRNQQIVSRPVHVGLVRSFCDGIDIGTISNAGTGAFLKAA
jgi:hypothetical protein